ncbi:MAG: hypothetical protein AAFR61_18740 [Bacteroidota bacterium]
MEHQDTELIEAYLAGELTTEEKAAFEARLKDETDFRKKYQAQQLIHQGMKGLEAENFLAQLKHWEAEAQEPGPSEGQLIPGWVSKVGIAATILIAGLIIIRLLFLSTYTQSQFMADHFSQTDLSRLKSASETDSITSVLEQVQSDCEPSGYLLTELSPSHPAIPYAALVIGECLLKNGAYQEASAFFEVGMQHQQDYMEISIPLYKGYLLALIGAQAPVSTIDSLFAHPPASAAPGFLEGELKQMQQDYAKIDQP